MMNSGAIQRLTACLLMLAPGAVGCGAFTSEPPQRVSKQAEEALADARFPDGTTQRVTVQRPEIEPASPLILPREERGLPYMASEALARIGPPAVPQVRQLLHDPRPEIRVKGADILAEIGPDAKDAVPDLTALLSDPDADVRAAAAHALGQIGPSASDAVPALLDVITGAAPPAAS